MDESGGTRIVYQLDVIFIPSLVHASTGLKFEESVMC